MIAAQKLPIRMTVQDFFRWESEDGLVYELADGVPRAIVPTSLMHGFLHVELGRRIGNHLREVRTNCHVLMNVGVIPRLFPTRNVRVPDLSITCAPITPGQVTVLDPLLLVEILSAADQAKTWSNVWTYMTMPSVQEILVLDTTRIAAEILRRKLDEQWADEPEQVTDGELVLTSIGFRVAMAELYARTGLAC